MRVFDLAHHFPVKGLAGAAVDPRGCLGIEQHGAVEIGDAQGIARLANGNGLDDPAMLCRTERRAFVAMQLQYIQWADFQYRVDFVLRRVDEQADGGDEGRKSADDACRGVWCDIAWRVRIKHEAQRIGAQAGSRGGILAARDAAYLDPGVRSGDVLYRLHRLRLRLAGEKGE